MEFLRVQQAGCQAAYALSGLCTGAGAGSPRQQRPAPARAGLHPERPPKRNGRRTPDPTPASCRPYPFYFCLLLPLAEALAMARKTRPSPLPLRSLRSSMPSSLALASVAWRPLPLAGANPEFSSRPEPLEPALTLWNVVDCAIPSRVSASRSWRSRSKGDGEVALADPRETAEFAGNDEFEKQTPIRSPSDRPRRATRDRVAGGPP